MPVTTLHEFCVKNDIGTDTEERLAQMLDMNEGKHDNLPESDYQEAHQKLIEQWRDRA